MCTCLLTPPPFPPTSHGTASWFRCTIELLQRFQYSKMSFGNILYQPLLLLQPRWNKSLPPGYKTDRVNTLATAANNWRLECTCGCDLNLKLKVTVWLSYQFLNIQFRSNSGFSLFLCGWDGGQCPCWHGAKVHWFKLDLEFWCLQSQKN